MMLFFRSEEQIAAWCRARNIAPNPAARMDQLWQMAVTWYGTRLEPQSRRPKPEEIRGIFEGVGLRGDFWDPRADTFP
jgi:hypothetical protein